MQAPSLRHAGIMLAAVMFAVGVVAPTYAQTPGPTPQPATGTGTLYTISGDPLEFDFLYAGENRPVQVLLGNPAGHVGFNVYADWQWRDMAAGNRSISPLGSGTANPNEPAKLFWEGSSPEGGFYHVQVYRREPGTASFWIALSGPGAASPLVPVSSAPPKPSKPVQITAQPAITATSTLVATSAPAKSVAAAPAAKRPTATAQPTQAPRTGAGNWQAIADAPMEYVFRYGGGSAPARISVAGTPAGGVGFNVYTDPQWTELGNGRYWTVPVGRGTANAYQAGDLYWEARSPVPEQYHIQVYRLSNQPTQFWIDMKGEGAASELKPMSPAVPVK